MMTLKDFGISTSVVQETAAAADIKSVPLVAGTVNNQKSGHNESRNSLDIKDSDFTLFL